MRADNGADAGERVTIQDAARLMGISEGAARKRVDRGTLASEKGEDGRVYVRLPDRRDDRVDVGVDGRADTNPRVEIDAYEKLVEDLGGQVEYLREELARERERNAEESRENRRIIAGLIQRVPELEPAGDSADAQQPSDGRESVHEGSGGAQGREPRTEAQAGSQEPRRGFWQRLFGS